MIERLPELVRFGEAGRIDGPIEWRSILAPVAAPWSRVFKPFAVLITFGSRLKLRRSRATAKVINDFVLHNPHQPGAFRAASGVTVLRTDGGEQSLLQKIF